MSVHDARKLPVPVIGTLLRRLDPVHTGGRACCTIRSSCRGTGLRAAQAATFHGQQVGHGAHAAAAVVNVTLAGSRPASRLIELGAQLLGCGLEAAVGPQVPGEGAVEGAGDVAGHRVQRLRLRPETAAHRRGRRSVSSFGCAQCGWRCPPVPSAVTTRGWLQFTKLPGCGGAARRSAFHWRPMHRTPARPESPPSSTATASWPHHLSIHHRRPQ